MKILQLNNWFQGCTEIWIGLWLCDPYENSAPVAKPHAIVNFILPVSDYEIGHMSFSQRECSRPIGGRERTPKYHFAEVGKHLD
jgi:hypothetical protein